MASTTFANDENRTSNGNFCHVNKRLLLHKAHYFLFFGALTGVIVPMILYCQQLGMSVSMVGVLFAVLPFVQCISKPVTGGIADKFQKHRTVFLTSLLVLTISMFSANFIPKVSKMMKHITWSPENLTVFDCPLPSTSAPISSNMLLTMCDYEHDNESTLSLQVLATSTVSCNMSCDTNTLTQIDSLFCETDNPNCLSRERYSFYTIHDKQPLMNLALSILSSPQNAKLSPHTTQADLFCATFLVSNISIDTTVLFQTYPNVTAVTACPKNVSVHFGCSALCSTNATSSDDDFQPNLDLQFTWIWLSCLIGWSCYGSVLSTSDSILIQELGENKNDFGKTRLFCSAGWGFMSIVSAVLIDYFSEGLPEKNYAPGFYLFLVLMILDIIVALQIKVHISEKPKKLLKEVIALFGNFNIVFFTLAVFFSGVNTGFLWTFVVVYANELNGSQLIIGLNYGVECFLSEIPMFMISGWIIEQFGHSNCLSFVLFVNGLKSLLYSFIYNAWYMLFIALVHGVTYGLLYAAMSSYASVIAPIGASATLQGLFQGIFEGAGVGTGSLLGGFFYERIGGRRTFLMFGLFTMSLSVVHYLGNCILVKFSKGSETRDSKEIGK